ncbi:MAG: hypothetical protein ACXWF8_14120 [Methylobacter sp.]
MNKTINLFGLALILATGIAYAEAAFDFETLMETIDTNSRNLQGSLSGKDANTSIELAKKMQSDFKLVEGFFEKRGNSADAVVDAKKYEDLAAEVVKFVEANDFDTASSKALELTKNCDNACHDAYKPL